MRTNLLPPLGVLLTLSCLACDDTAGETSACAPTTEILESFDPDAFEHAEAVLVGSGGRIYVTLHLADTVYARDPAGTATRIPLPGAVPGTGTAITGIARLADEIYVAVASANAVLAGVWQLEGDTLRRVAPLPAEAGINGLTADAARDRLLVTDSRAGTILVVSPRTGEVTTWAAGNYLEPTGEGYGGAFGVNGIKVAGDAVYVSVPARETRWRIPVLASGLAGTPAPFLAIQGLGATDDFDLDLAGTVWLGAQFADQEAVLVTLDGGSRAVLATADDGLDQPTAVAIDEQEPGTAYVTSGGFGGGAPARHPNLMRVRWSSCP